MSIFDKLEMHASTLLQELREHILHQVNKGNRVDPTLHDFVTHLEAHVNNTTVVAAAPVAVAKSDEPTAAPMLSNPVAVETPVVEPVQHTEDPDHATN